MLDGGPISVYGNDYPTPDGTCVRDYVHVRDLAAAHVRVLEADRLPSGRSFNCGTGHGHSVLQVIEAAAERLRVKPKIEIGPRRPGDPASLVADPAALLEAVSWRPVHSTLEELVGSAADWERARRR